MTRELLEGLDVNKLPEHIAIIMDGNGRWAESKGLPRTAGHKQGVESLREIIAACSDLGIKILSLFAFSTENWKRPKFEVDYLMNLLVIYLKNELEELNKKNIVIRIMGDVEALPVNVRKTLYNAIEITANNSGMIVNVALNYGGRAELIRATKQIVKEVLSGRLRIEDINERILENHLYTKGLPQPDILIRPSGELRISNFMLWQCAYSEFWFSKVYWPDFTKRDLIEAIKDYQKRERRFGGLKG